MPALQETAVEVAHPHLKISCSPRGASSFQLLLNVVVGEGSSWNWDCLGTLHNCSGDLPDSMGTGSPRIESTTFFGANWGRRLARFLQPLQNRASDSEVGRILLPWSEASVGSLGRKTWSEALATLVGRTSLLREGTPIILKLLWPSRVTSLS